MSDGHERRSDPASRDRRLFLASTGAALSSLAAGCVGELGGDDSDGSNNPDANGSDAATNATDGPSGGPDEPDQRSDAEATVPEQIGEVAFPIESLALDARTDDLTPVVDAFGDAGIVGIGTATHGTAEFYRLRHRLLRHLIEADGLRTIAVEDGVGRLRGVNDYLRGDEGDAATAMTEHMDPIHHSDAMVAFLRWLRSFNADRDPGDQVALYGVDSQFFAYPAAAIWAYLGAVDQAYRDTLPERYAVLADRGMQGAWRDESAFEDRLAGAEAMVADLRDRLASEEASYREASSDRAYELARRYLRGIEQAHEIHATRFEDAGPAMERREEHMAENVTWLAEGAAGDRIAFLAHNGHVKRGDHHEGWPAAGQLIADEHDDGYYPLGMAFGRGSVGARNPETGEIERFEVGDPLDGSLADALQDVPRDRFVLDFERAGAREQIAEWLVEVDEMRVVGNTFVSDADPEEFHVEADVDASFDGVAFVAEGSAAVYDG